MYEHLTILLVDDDAVDRMAVRRALKSAGVPCTIEEATDRTTTLAAIGDVSFDVILLDYRLPGTDGLVLLREIREHGDTTPIIMLTGQGDEQLAVELLRSGATDYLTKSAVSPDVLSQSIHRALRVHRAEQLAAQAEQALRDASERRHWLAEASQYLLESLDSHVVMNRLVNLGAEQIGAACALDMLLEDQAISRLAVAAPTRPQLAALLDETGPHDSGGQAGPPDVIRVCEPRVFDLAEEKSDAEVELFLLPYRAAGVTSMMIVPLLMRGQAMGAITFVCDSVGVQFSRDDVLLAMDLAQRAAIALDNARLYREAQEAVRVRDAFLSVAAHELKTPLTTLYGNIQLMQRRAQREGTMNERDQRTLQIVFEQTARLNKMITALLDLSRLQMGQFIIQPVPIDFGALIQRVVDELQPSLDRHTVQLIGIDEPLMVEGDELRLEQVLQNLIQNAIKYSPNGGVIGVRATRTPDGIAVAISDQGIGIPPSSIPSLFRRFFRASNVHEHRISGIGVGLYVVNEIVARHGGHISVESIEGVGTTFTVYLPAHAEAVVVA